MKKILSLIIAILLFSLVRISVQALDPHGIEGYVFNMDGTQVSTGIPVTINDTNSSDFVSTQTSGPPIATGFYSATINGSDNDTVIVTAWNATHHGKTTVLLLNISQSPATYANVTLNLTRASETNVTITDPDDEDTKELDIPFYLVANISIIGGQNGTNCSATLSITNEAVFNLGSGEKATHFLGNISLWSSILTEWNVTSISQGQSDFIVNASCASDNISFENSSQDRVYNITAQYVPTPEPHGIEGFVFMRDGITQVESGIPVSINETNDYVTTQTFGPPIAPGFYSATINGTTGNNIIVTAWNSTAYGKTITTLLGISQSPATYANVSLNNTRPSETNVTIIDPQSFAVRVVNQSFEVIANISIIGGQNGTNCSAYINFSNTTILQLGSGETWTHDMGNISIGNTVQTRWNVTGVQEGISNITVRARCDSDGMNFDGVDSDTVENISFLINRAPIIQHVVCDNPIILSPGSARTVRCNASVNDPDSRSDILIVNSSFFDTKYAWNSSDDNNYHYTNNSCRNVSYNYTAINYSCTFRLWYYSNNATWNFNLTATDSQNNSGFGYASSLVEELYAVNVSPLVIDYGALAPTNTSPADFEAKVNNYGNKDINITLEGFGINKEDNLSMDCSLGNISVYYQHY
jgi:hypothetical protein